MSETTNTSTRKQTALMKRLARMHDHKDFPKAMEHVPPAEEDVDRIMQHVGTMIASDGGIYQPGPDVPHPRNYGAFARVLGVYVRSLGPLTSSEGAQMMIWGSTSLEVVKLAVLAACLTLMLRLGRSEDEVAS